MWHVVLSESDLGRFCSIVLMCSHLRGYIFVLEIGQQQPQRRLDLVIWLPLKHLRIRPSFRPLASVHMHDADPPSCMEQSLRWFGPFQRE